MTSGAERIGTATRTIDGGLGACLSLFEPEATGRCNSKINEDSEVFSEVAALTVLTLE